MNATIASSTLVQQPRLRSLYPPKCLADHSARQSSLTDHEQACPRLFYQADLTEPIGKVSRVPEQRMSFDTKMAAWRVFCACSWKNLVDRQPDRRDRARSGHHGQAPGDAC